MRVAVIVAPWDPRSSDAGTWSEAVAWLGATLGRLGFRVSLVDGAQDVGQSLAQALDGVSADDDVLVHVTGRLARRGVLRISDGRWLPLRTLGEALAPHSANISVFAELVHEDEADDALVAADHVASTVAALGARERGYGVVAAVRPAGAPIEGFAFTKLVFLVAEAARRGESQLTSIYDRVTAMPESLAAAQSFTCVRGRGELDWRLPRLRPPSSTRSSRPRPMRRNGTAPPSSVASASRR